MKDVIYLVVNQKKVVRMNTRYLPALQSGEFMFELKVEVPDKFFQRVIPSATLLIPEDYVATVPQVIVDLGEAIAGPNDTDGAS